MVPCCNKREPPPVQAPDKTGVGIGRFLPAYFCQLVVILALISGHQGTGLFIPASCIRIIKYTYIHRISYVYQNHQHHGRSIRAVKKSQERRNYQFLRVIVRYYPVRRKLSDVLGELGDCTDLAESIGNVSKEMRKTKMRNVRF